MRHQRASGTLQGHRRQRRRGSRVKAGCAAVLPAGSLLCIVICAGRGAKAAVPRAQSAQGRCIFIVVYNGGGADSTPSVRDGNEGCPPGTWARKATAALRSRGRRGL